MGWVVGGSVSSSSTTYPGTSLRARSWALTLAAWEALGTWVGGVGGGGRGGNSGKQSGKELEVQSQAAEQQPYIP